METKSNDGKVLFKFISIGVKVVLVQVTMEKTHAASSRKNIQHEFMPTYREVCCSDFTRFRCYEILRVNVIRFQNIVNIEK